MDFQVGNKGPEQQITPEQPVLTSKGKEGSIAEKSLDQTAIESVLNPSESKISTKMTYSSDQKSVLPSSTKEKMMESAIPKPPPPMEEGGDKNIQETSYVKGVNYGPEAEATDLKVHTTYLYYPHDTDINQMYVEKSTLYENPTTGVIKQEISRKTYTYKKELGEGTFGIALLYQHIPKEGEKAGKSKVLKIGKEEEGEIEVNKGYNIVKEQRVNPETGKPLRKVVGLISKMEGQGKGTSLQSFYGRGDLITSAGRLSPDEMIDATVQLAFGLNHLHTDTDKKPGRVHRDIKPDNVFHRSKNGKTEFVLADLDGAQKLKECDRTVFTHTEGFISARDNAILLMDSFGPEGVLSARLHGYPIPYLDLSEEEQIEFNKSTDIYALGVTLKEVITGVSCHEYEEINLMTLDDIPNLDTCTEEKLEKLNAICNLINYMTAYEWQDRPDADTILGYLRSTGIETPTY
jgi:hypothetical protein